MSNSYKEELLQLTHEENWSPIILRTTPDILTKILSYEECMSLAYDLFFKNLRDDDIQDFAVRLFFSIRDTYASDWSRDWKNDAFLGQLCGLTWRYDERYECYKKAYDKLRDPPDSLLLLLAECNSAPGTPSISDGESETYLKRAIAKKLTYEAAIWMRGLARSKNDQEQEKYWDKLSKELEEKNIHTETIMPDILQNKPSTK